MYQAVRSNAAVFLLLAGTTTYVACLLWAAANVGGAAFWLLTVR